MNRVTVVLPVYNGEKFLLETIHSVLNQTYSEFDFLIIDDVSSDASEQLILSIKDERIKFIKNEQNLGAVATPQKGMDMSHTEYIARIDQDDLWHPEKLKKQISYMDEHPEVGICGTSIELFGDTEGVKLFPTTNESIKAGFIWWCCMSHPSVVFRKSFLETSGQRYTQGYALADDYKMWIDCIDKTQIYNIPEVLVKYRQHESQICSAKNAEKQLITTNKVRLEMLLRINKDFTEEQINFHLNRFVERKIDSAKDYKKFIDWSRILLKKNKDGGEYINPKFLKDELAKITRAAYKQYIYQKYFQEYSFRNWMRYFCSFDWRHIKLKTNIKLFFDCLR